MKILFSIVILTKDSIGVIERLVDSLLNQKFDHEYEIIFMDNSSKDRTVDYLKKSKFKNKKIINVPAGEFSHSGTRMRAAEIAKGKYLIFFTDDIIPIGESFLFIINFLFYVLYFIFYLFFHYKISERYISFFYYFNKYKKWGTILV